MVNLCQLVSAWSICMLYRLLFCLWYLGSNCSKNIVAMSMTGNPVSMTYYLVLCQLFLSSWSTLLLWTICWWYWFQLLRNHYLQVSMTGYSVSMTYYPCTVSTIISVWHTICCGLLLMIIFVPFDFNCSKIIIIKNDMKLISMSIFI